MTVFWPSNTKNSIDAIRNVIGRNITVQLPTISGCSFCSLDVVTNESTNPICPVCNGEYWVKNYHEQEILAHITWAKIDNLGWETGGQLKEGECRIQIEYTDLNKLVTISGEAWNVDGKIMTRKSYSYGGVPDINRIVIILKETEDGN